MNKIVKSTRGVTLLEVMLVLAIAAMIIVMSIRYYQSATASQQANSALEQIQGITAAVDSLAQGSGAYESAQLNNSVIGPLLPGGATAGFNAPWGSTIALAYVGATSYTVDLGTTPADICPLIYSKLILNTHYTLASDPCGSTAADFKYTYLSSPP